MQRAVGDGSGFGARITFIPQDAPLGIAHGVKVAADYLGESRFVLYLGDNFVLGGIKPYVDAFIANGAARRSSFIPSTIREPSASPSSTAQSDADRREAEGPAVATLL